MKKAILIVILVLMATVTNAPGSMYHGNNPYGGILGTDGKFAGCFCCVKQTCVVTRNEAECKKIGGVKIKKCEECEKAEKK